MLAIVLAIWMICFAIVLLLLLLKEFLDLYIKHLDRKVKKLREKE